MEQSTKTINLSALRAVSVFMLEHPDLPAPTGVSVHHHSDPGLSVVLESAEQVRAWADAIDAEVRVSETGSGVVVHSAYTFTPIYVSASYCDRADESVSA